MNRFWEIIFGMQRGFLSQEGELGVEFAPRWPLQGAIPTAIWNLALLALAVWLVRHVYHKSLQSRPIGVLLGVLRASLLGLLILLLNRPSITLTQTRIEPSVVAVLVDESLSMGITDVQAGTTRLAQAQSLLGPGGGVITELSARHDVRLFRFASSLNETAKPSRRETAEMAVSPDSEIPTAAAADAVLPAATEAPTTNAPMSASPVKVPGGATHADPAMLLVSVDAITPVGTGTRVVHSLEEAAGKLRGQRAAGLVVLTDGRQTAGVSEAESLGRLVDAQIPVFAIPIGSERPPASFRVRQVVSQDVAFAGDVVSIAVTLDTAGATPGESVAVELQDARTGSPMLNEDGTAVKAVATVGDQGVSNVELLWKPAAVGDAELLVVIRPESPDIDASDNTRPLTISVLDTRVRVLYVDGYPRWEYRYLKTQLIRDRTVDVSCLLTSADSEFAQEGDIPVTRFPETIEELLAYDVLVVGDVDPRYFTDNQLSLVQEFVSRKGGGLAAVSGLRHMPREYRNTPIEPLLPILIGRGDPPASTGVGFRPVLTRAGSESTIFRFFADPAENAAYIADRLPMLYWYASGVVSKPGIGEVMAEHPTELASDGGKAPLLVMGRYGSGRVLWSAIDDSWRWRYYTGETVFDTYWVQQVRQLAQGRKVGQRKATMAAEQAIYEPGNQVRVVLRALDPQIASQLPAEVPAVVTIESPAGWISPPTDPSSGPASFRSNTTRMVALVREAAGSDRFTASFPADRVGRFTVRTQALAGVDTQPSATFDVVVPQLELADPRVDRSLLTRIANETKGRLIEPTEANGLASMIPSAERSFPVRTSSPLGGAPAVLTAFTLLIAGEWVIRKLLGLI